MVGTAWAQNSASNACLWCGRACDCTGSVTASTAADTFTISATYVLTAADESRLPSRLPSLTDSKPDRSWPGRTDRWSRRTYPLDRAQQKATLSGVRDPALMVATTPTATATTTTTATVAQKTALGLGALVIPDT